ncbi:MAG: hypothetical protein OXJ52_00350, partial [Oligoflexia bacterium]|nr:hypothetical protein [Oligoflexia bacterium]
PTGYTWTGTQCVEICTKIFGLETFHGMKLVAGRCFPFGMNSGSGSSYSVLIPSLGLFVSLGLDYPTYSNNKIFNKMKYAFDLGNTIQGFDENENQVSFKPCPSGQVWIGSRCVEYCAETQTIEGIGYTHTSSMPGIKIQNQCYPTCIRLFGMFSKKNNCFFVPHLKVWLLHTREVVNSLPNTYYKLDSDLSKYILDKF